MPGGARSDGMLSIGELAERAGVTVKTVRFYSDSGLLPEAVRSSGGHRRYGPEAVDRLRLIRSLRALDLPVPEVGRALGREDALEAALDGQLRELGSQLTALRWREASLRLLRDCSEGERADRLRLIGAMGTPPGTEAMARFWRLTMPPRVPARLVAAVVDAAVPQPPEDPSPEQVLVFARMHALVSDRSLCTPHGRSVARSPAGEDGRPELLYDGLIEAYELAAPDLRDRRAPYGSEALDCFVAAHARSRGARDTPAFRRLLSDALMRDTVPVARRYWELLGELNELSAPPSALPEPTAGAIDGWLRTALKTQVAREAA